MSEKQKQAFLPGALKGSWLLKDWKIGERITMNIRPQILTFGIVVIVIAGMLCLKNFYRIPKVIVGQPEVQAEVQATAEAEEFVSPKSLPEDITLATNVTVPTLDASNGVKRLNFHLKPKFSLSEPPAQAQNDRTKQTN